MPGVTRGVKVTPGVHAVCKTPRIRYSMIRITFVGTLPAGIIAFRLTPSHRLRRTFGNRRPNLGRRGLAPPTERAAFALRRPRRITSQLETDRLVLGFPVPSFQ